MLPQLKRKLLAARKADYRCEAAHHRLGAQLARQDTKEWIVNRRERTHRLIELGGLVVKSGLDQLLADDRAAIYGGLMELVLQLQDEQRRQTIALWRRQGQRAFKATPSGDHS